MFVVQRDDCVYLVSFVENEHSVFLKTIILSGRLNIRLPSKDLEAI